MNHQRNVPKTILTALSSREDQAGLRTILGSSEWNVCTVPNFRTLCETAKTCLSRVVITNTRLADGHNWKDLLRELRGWRTPPQLIVVDRQADDALWAEVLNLGAYDLLITPFEASEAQRVISRAWEFCIRQQARRAESPSSTESAGYAAAGLTRHARTAG